MFAVVNRKNDMTDSSLLLAGFLLGHSPGNSVTKKILVTFTLNTACLKK